jgi:hypothetical protein
MEEITDLEEAIFNGVRPWLNRSIPYIEKLIADFSIFKYLMVISEECSGSEECDCMDHPPEFNALMMFKHIVADTFTTSFMRIHVAAASFSYLLRDLKLKIALLVRDSIEPCLMWYPVMLVGKYTRTLT